MVRDEAKYMREITLRVGAAVRYLLRVSFVEV